MDELNNPHIILATAAIISAAGTKMICAINV
ncbi:MAG: hypothetical protein ACI94Y_003463, partial [Maribacter sp.]